MQPENHFGLVNLDIYNKENIMEENKCNCGPDCTCGCQEGKECTCKDEKCKCGDKCICGCGENCECDETCTCGCQDKK